MKNIAITLPDSKQNEQVIRLLYSLGLVLKGLVLKGQLKLQKTLLVLQSEAKI